LSYPDRCGLRLMALNELAGLLPHAAMGPVERMVRRHHRRRGFSEISMPPSSN
jgi:hypothetical protein